MDDLYNPILDIIELSTNILNVHHPKFLIKCLLDDAHHVVLDISLSGGCYGSGGFRGGPGGPWPPQIFCFSHICLHWAILF